MYIRWFQRVSVIHGHFLHQTELFRRGDVALLTRSTFSDVSAPWKLERLWTTGHAGVVRSSLWDESVRPASAAEHLTCVNSPYRTMCCLLAAKTQSSMFGQAPV